MNQVLWDIKDAYLGSPDARLDRVNLEMRSGVTAVLGQSGAGKTSLLNLLVEFETADGGQVIRKFSHIAGGHAIPLYWTPQDAGLWPDLTCRQHVESVIPIGGGGELAGASVDEPNVIDSNILLDGLDLSSRADAYPHEMSQGQRGRLSIARALATNAAVYVFDEPLAHVDPTRVFSYWAFILELIERSGSSMIFATHRPDVVLAFAKDVVCLEKGNLIYHGQVHELYETAPDETSARCLGEVNWLEPGEAEAWLSMVPRGDDKQDESGSEKEPCGLESPCVRPEKLLIEEDSGSACVVESYVFRGMVSDVQLYNERMNRSRRFVVRSQGRENHNQNGIKGWPVGQRVSLRLVLSLWLPLFLLLFISSGCDEEDAESRLPVTKVIYHAMLPDGASLPQPRAISNGNAGELIVLDKAGRVLILDYEGNVIRQWRMPKSDFGHPEGACLLNDGRIAVADTHYNQILIFDQNGKVDLTFGSLGEEDGQFTYPVKVVQDDDDNLYVIEYGGNDRIQKFTVTGKHLKTFATFGTKENQLARPAGLVWHEGKLFVCEADNQRVQVFTDDGEFVSVLNDETATGELDFPYDLAIGPGGLIYVIEYGGGRVTVMKQDGQRVGVFGSRGRGEEQFATPWGITVDPRGHVWIVDTGNRRIVELVLVMEPNL